MGGESYQLHAPAFTDTSIEAEAIMQMRQVKEVLDHARKAQIAIVGVGNLTPDTSSFYRFTSLPAGDLKRVIEEKHGVGEVLAHVLDRDGQLCAREYSDRIIGLSLDELKAIPLTIGVAAMENKSIPVAAALKSKILSTIILDERTARSVIELF